MRFDGSLHRVSAGRTRADGPSFTAHAAALPDPAAPPYRLPASVAAKLYQHARECHPEECCGLLFGGPLAPAHRVVRCRNVEGTRAASLSRAEAGADAGSPSAGLGAAPELSARNAFWMDMSDMLRALREAETRGEELRAIYHSHVDAEAHLSWIDASCAVGPSGTPHYPGAAQLVLSVRDGIVRDAVAYVWDVERGRFIGRRVELIPSDGG
jgi:proteasome lid subunit RPN8/RPN11